MKTIVDTCIMNLGLQIDFPCISKTVEFIIPSARVMNINNNNKTTCTTTTKLHVQQQQSYMYTNNKTTFTATKLHVQQQQQKYMYNNNNKTTKNCTSFWQKKEQCNNVVNLEAPSLSKCTFICTCANIYLTNQGSKFTFKNGRS